MFLISLVVYKKQPVSLFIRYFPLFFFVDFISNVYISYTSSRGIHNTAVVNAVSIFEISFLCFVVGQVVVNRIARNIIFYSIIAFIVFSVINLLFVQKKIGFNPINYTVGSLLIVAFCIYYYIELFQKAEAESLVRLPAFWIISAILFNTVLSFPMFALLSFMDEMTKLNAAAMNLFFENIVAIFNIISILTYILYSIGFLCRIRTSKSIS